MAFFRKCFPPFFEVVRLKIRKNLKLEKFETIMKKHSFFRKKALPSFWKASLTKLDGTKHPGASRVSCYFSVLKRLYFRITVHMREQQNCLRTQSLLRIVKSLKRRCPTMICSVPGKAPNFRLPCWARFQLPIYTRVLLQGNECKDSPLR